MKHAESKAALLQKLLPIRLAEIMLQVSIDRHNFLCEQGAVLESGSVVDVKRGNPLSHQIWLGAVQYPTAFFDLSDEATEYKLTLRYCLDDGKYCRPDEIVKVHYRAPEEKRESVGNLVDLRTSSLQQ